MTRYVGYLRSRTLPVLALVLAYQRVMARRPQVLQETQQLTLELRP